MTPIPRPFALALALFGGLALLTAGCGGQNPYQAAESANSVDAAMATNPAAAGGEVNVFTPDAQNVTSCVGTLERPECGSKSKGGWRMYLTFAVLIGGLSFVGWRIVKGVRPRDAAVNGPVEGDAAKPTGAEPPTP